MVSQKGINKAAWDAKLLPMSMYFSLFYISVHYGYSVTLLLNYIQLIKSLHNYCDQLQTKKSGLTEIHFTATLIYFPGPRT